MDHTKAREAAGRIALACRAHIKRLRRRKTHPYGMGLCWSRGEPVDVWGHVLRDAGLMAASAEDYISSVNATCKSLDYMSNLPWPIFEHIQLVCECNDKQDVSGLLDGLSYLSDYFACWNRSGNVWQLPRR